MSAIDVERSPDAPSTDAEFVADVARVVALIQGLESADYHCPCGRYYKLGIAEKLREVLPRVRAEVARRSGAEPVADTSDLGFLSLKKVEVD